MRTHRIWRLAFLVAFCLACCSTVVADPVTQIKLLLSADAARPGETIWAGLQMDIPEGYHIYWRNGGDAGIPVSIDWKLTPGVTAGAIQWPPPVKEIDKSGDEAFITYIYSNQVVLLIPIKLADNVTAGPNSLTAHVNWMECAQSCVMADGDVHAQLAVGSEDKPSKDAATIEKWRKLIPQPVAPNIVKAYWQGTQIISNSRPLLIEWKGAPAAADFYPDSATNFSVGGATDLSKNEDGSVVLRKIVTMTEKTWPDQVTGVLVGNPTAQHPDAYELSVAIQSPPAGAKKADIPPIVPAVLFVQLFGAFLGGLILNIMPCVLPVIALKIFSFVKQAGEKPARVRNLGLVYGVGVLASFLALAALAVGVQAAGGLANWGDLFRHPQVQLALTVLMTLIALNLFGVFEITLSSRATGAAYDLTARQGYSGAFFNGVLATVLATPCTAPYLATALGFALGQSAIVIVLFFLAAGIGFALPFVLLCMQPKWMAFMPKPGAWMEKFKIAMGFPMIATAFWLMWLTATDENGILWLGLFLVVIAMVAWIWGQFVQRSSSGKMWAGGICVALLALDFIFVLGGHSTKIDWQPWSPQAVADAQRAGHPVLVDFTAKSCLTCQLNRASSIEVDSTRAKIKELGVVALVGDFTRQDPAIAKELRDHDRSGVPLVLIYSKDPAKKAEELPTFPLTPKIVTDALDRAAQSANKALSQK